MRERKKLPSQERLRYLFDYHPNGYFIRRVRVSGTFIGQEVRGSENGDGYLQAFVDGRTYYFHRLVYAWHHGEVPDIVDHDDRDKLNCRIGNLKAATPSESTLNTRTRSDNTSGVRGVYIFRGKYCVRPRRNGTYHWVGAFATMDEAKAALEAFT